MEPGHLHIKTERSADFVSLSFIVTDRISDVSSSLVLQSCVQVFSVSELHAEGRWIFMLSSNLQDDYILSA